VTPQFQRFLDEHYAPFCKTAIRAMHTYGFVPWRARRLARGDLIPEVLPAGTFSWHTEIGPDEQERDPSRYRPAQRKRQRPADASQLYMAEDDDSRLVVYRISPTAGGVREEDVSLYTAHPPALDVSTGSVLHATVPSPLAYLLTDYKNLREAQKRRSHADAWNTTARLVSTFRPNLRVQDDPTQYLMDFVHEDHFAKPAVGDGFYPSFSAHNVWQREHVMRRQASRLFSGVFGPASSSLFFCPGDGDALEPPPGGVRAAQGPRRRAPGAAGAVRGPGLPAGQVPPGRVRARRRALRDDHRA